MNIIQKIREIRENKKITRKEMASYLSISADTYKDIEYERIRLSLENFILICKALQISPIELIKENEDDHYVLISKKDIEDLNRVISKINKQTFYSENNSNNVNIGGNVNNSYINSFNKK